MPKIKIVIALFALTLLATGCSVTSLLPKSQKTISIADAKAKTEKFVNETLLGGEQKATIKDVVKENNMYKIAIELPGRPEPIETYLTLDGTKFFPQAMDIAQTEKQAADQKANPQPTEPAAPAAEVPKTDKPVIELFVMSYCPYGTQIEKGIIPVIELLGNKVDFELKFVSYAMHDKKEIDENLRQSAINQIAPDKLIPYLKCFLQDSKADDCVKSLGLDTARIQTTMAETDQKFEITKKFEDKSSWVGQYPPFDVNKADNTKYNVQGSPTLIINGVASQANRDPQSLLTAVCNAFNTAPEQCSKKLATDQPSAGFGYNPSTDNSTNAQCH